MEKASKIIITSTQYPRNGGGATAAYELHKHLVKYRIPSICIFFDNKICDIRRKYDNSSKLNPDKLPHVYCAPNAKNFMNLNLDEYERIINIAKSVHGSQPYHIYGFNRLAPSLSRGIFSESIIYYIVVGCGYISNNNLIDATSFLKTPIDLGDTANRYLSKEDSMEKYAMQVSDFIVPISELIKNLLEHTYKVKLDNFIDLHKVFQFNNEMEPITTRKYDIGFISSNYGRLVKNIDLVKIIYNSKELEKYNKLCVGHNSSNLITDKSWNLSCMDFLNQDEIISILNQTKIIIIPSYLESYSIVSLEATQCGCIVLTTKNAACASTFNQNFIMDTYDADEWITKINQILKNYDYHKKIFYNNYQSGSIESLWNRNVIESKEKINIVFVSVDIPYVGGAATNLYKLIKLFSKDELFNVVGIFFTNLTGDHNPDKIENIYKIRMSEKIENELNELKATFEKIDIIFCKNYKIVPLMKKVFPNVKIIFSPSGLRCMTDVTNNEYVMDIKLENDKNTNYILQANMYNFIKDNDQYLDYYSLIVSDTIIPNSLLTYNIIKNMYGERHNLHYPISLTNVSLVNAYQSDLSKREFDILFCCVSWKRKCKNYNLVLDIVRHESLKDKKIIIIGEYQIKRYGRNIQTYTYMENDKLSELYKKVKLVVIPSKYDSNPNILIEAFQAGCNVVTSINVGNYENLHNACLVSNYHDSEDWVNTIQNNLTTQRGFLGPSSDKVFNQLKRVFLKTQKKSVFVYKISPDIDLDLPNIEIKNDYFDYEEVCDHNSDCLVYETINYDIYFSLFFEMSKKEECDDINYILYDPIINKNMLVYVYKVYPFYSHGIKIWKIKDIHSLFYFNNASFYFMRGTYYNFFRRLIPYHAKSILYPATAMLQNKRIVSQPPKFDIILVHEDSSNGFYRNGRCVPFHKFAPEKFVYNNSIRYCDLCFVATDKQTTKNHHLFLHFLKYLNAQETKRTVIFVGNLPAILIANKMPKLIDELTNVDITYYNLCSRDMMVEIYNKSKINILFSGRDAYPRVISESAACGCFNIALDTLSDGKNFYDGYLGSLIGNKDVTKKLQRSSSLSYQPDDRLWKEIEQYMDLTYDHENISVYFKNKYNVTNTINEIYIK